MCGRFAFYSPHESVIRLFGLDPDSPPIEPRYNIAPTQYIAAVISDPHATRRLAMLYWGLVPSWAKEKAIGARMINARGETLKEKPSFRVAYRRRRCLVLADGYYEWQKRPDGKQPYLIRRADGKPFAMAGLWERWQPPGESEPLVSCTIVTTAAADALGHIHDRMPLILPADAYQEWLDPASDDLAPLDRLLVPSTEPFEPLAVSRRVNNARNEGAELIEPMVDQQAVDGRL
ncbi:MAG TPA: SOS response-associated peptidase [Steroidobacteraceae bacterium]|nr:SOS response-associated peptidase [Steroidobacteraceae bacterium]